MNKQEKHPTLNLFLSFDEKKHRYTDSNNIRYKGVTTWIKAWFEQFDAEGMAIKCSENPKKKEYFGKKPEEIMQKWAEKSKKSCEFGNNLHNAAEYWLKSNSKNCSSFTRIVWGEGKDKISKAKIALANFIDTDLLKEYEILGTEVLIFSPDLRVATMIDVLAKHKKTGVILIGDWKTNEKIKKKSFFNFKEYSYKMGLGEMECVMDCNYQHYALQVNLTQEILEREKYFPINTKFQKKIFHIKYDKKKDDFEVEKHTIHEKRKPVEIMIDKRLAEVAIMKMDECEVF